LQIDESIVTGESVPVHKHAGRLDPHTVLADRANLALAGTHATSGYGEGVVWATGDRTETGRIAWMIREATDLSTPLTRKIAEFSKLLLRVILGFSATVFLLGIWRGESAYEMFMASVALAVGAIPEGLPAAVTVVLAIGVSRMARLGAVVRRLPAVETLGSTTVICSDKTGTLTQNQMTVTRAYAAGQTFEITGLGYQMEGEFMRERHRIDPPKYPALWECLKAGSLCNEAALSNASSQWETRGDSTEAALLIAAEKAGLAGPFIRG